MKLEYELTRQDYVDFNIYHVMNSKSMKNRLLFVWFVSPVLFLIFPLLFRRVSPNGFWVGLVVFAVTAALWIILFPRKYKKSLAKSVNKMLDEGKNNGFLGMRSLTFSDEGITQVSEAGETKNNWNVVERLAITDNYIFIYIASVMAYVVPDRVFSDATEREAFIDIIKKNIA